MFSKTIVSALAAIATVQGLPAADPNPAGATYEVLDAFPDGAYSGYTYPNGTMVGHLIDETTGAIKRSIAVHPREPASSSSSSEVIPKRDRNHLQRRFVDCWSGTLDRQGTDAAAQCLRDIARQPGGIDIQTGSATAHRSCVTNGVRVYYCVNRSYSWGNANLEDINHGLRQMDSVCNAYQPGYFRWDGTPEIVGKARAEISICLP